MPGVLNAVLAGARRFATLNPGGQTVLGPGQSGGSPQPHYVFAPETVTCSYPGATFSWAITDFTGQAASWNVSNFSGPTTTVTVDTGTDISLAAKAVLRCTITVNGIDYLITAQYSYAP